MLLHMGAGMVSDMAADKKKLLLADMLLHMLADMVADKVAGMVVGMAAEKKLADMWLHMVANKVTDKVASMVADMEVVHYCTLSLFDIWVTRQIIITNSQWSIQRLSRWVTNYITWAFKMHIAQDSRVSYSEYGDFILIVIIVNNVYSGQSLECTRLKSMATCF